MYEPGTSAKSVPYNGSAALLQAGQQLPFLVSGNTPAQLTSNVLPKHRANIPVQVIYRRLRIGRDGHLNQPEAYDIS